MVAEHTSPSAFLASAHFETSPAQPIVPSLQILLGREHAEREPVVTAEAGSLP